MFPRSISTILNASLTRSLTTMGIERVDLFFLHSQLIEDGYQLPLYNEMRGRLATPRSVFQEAVIPAFSVCSWRARSAAGASHWASSRRLKP